jgi:hypothetical protein
MLLIFTLDAKSLFSNNEQADESKYIGALKDLVIATQKTRGLTNSYLNGNITSMLLVYGNREEMKKAIGIMESLPLAADPIINSRATTISQLLITLNRKAFKTKNPATIFENYTELIEQTLMLAQTVSKRGSDKLNPIGKSLSSIMMEVILPYTENVGQMRGMGSGLVAKRKVNKMQNAQMLALANEIEKLYSKLLVDINVVVSQNKEHFKNDINIKLQSIDKLTKSYIALTKKDVLEAKEINLNADEYFDKGTKIISLLIEVYNINNKIILEDSKGWF